MKERRRGLLKAARGAALCLCTLLWLCVAVLLLEAYATGKWWSIEHFNRYLQGRKLSPELWGQIDVAEDGRLVMSEAAMKQTMPSPAPVPKEDHLGTLFVSLNEEDRMIYAGLQEAVILIAKPDAEISNVYVTAETAGKFQIDTSRLADREYCNATIAKEVPGATDSIRRVFASGDPESIPCAVHGVSARMTSFPMRDSSGYIVSVVSSMFDVSEPSLTDVMAANPQILSEPQWKIPLLEYKKNVRLDDQDWFTNNVGFWDDDVALPKPANTFRIVCVGGSTTEEGWVVEWSYPNVLEKKLNEYFGGKPHFEVINAGVVALDSRGERKRMLDFLRLEPDLIIEYNIVNDLCHWLLPQWSEKMPPAAKILRRFEFIKDFFNAALWPDDQVLAERIEQVTLKNLGIMYDLAKKKGVAMAFGSFACPDPARLRSEERDYLEWQIRTFWQGKYYGFSTYRRVVGIYNGLLQAFCQKEGALYLPIAEEYEGDLTSYADICHMRPKGIQQKADIIFKHLKPYLESRR